MQKRTAPIVDDLLNMESGRLMLSHLPGLPVIRWEKYKCTTNGITVILP